MKNSHNQFLNKTIAMLIAILVISLPVNAQVLQTETSAEDTEDIITEGQFSEFALIAKEYEPKIVRSSLIEQNTIPIYIHLAAIPTDPTLSFPRIQPPLIVKEISNKTYLAGGIRYHQPKIFSWDDIGYIEARIKQIPKEDDVPDNIRTDLKIKINYEAESAAGLIGGTELKSMDFKRGLTVDDLFEDEQYSLFNGRGYVSINKIGSRSVSYQIYDENGKPIRTVSSSINRPSTEIRLIKTSTDPKDLIRIRTEKINDFSKNNIKIKIDNQEKILNEGSKIKGWRIKDINVNKTEYVVLYKTRVGTVYLSNQYKIYNSIEEMRRIYKKIKPSEYEEMKKDFEILERDFNEYEILQFNKGEQTKAVIDIGGNTLKLKEGATIPGTECKITDIGQSTARIQYKATEQGKTTTRTATLVLPRFEQTEYITDIETPTDFLSTDYCGEKIILKNIDFRKSTTFTVLSGARRGSTETELAINIPIDKKIFKLSPKKIDDLINKTEEQIKYLDEKITKLEKVVTQWRKICLITMATITVLNFLTNYKPAIVQDQEALAKKRKSESPKGLDIFGGKQLPPVTAKPCTKPTECTQGEYCKITDGKGFCTLVAGQQTTQGACTEKAGYRLIPGASLSPTEYKPTYIFENNYGLYFTVKRTGKPPKEVCSSATNSLLYKGDQPYIYTKNHEFIPYTGMNKKEQQQIKSAIVNGNKVIMIPLKDPTVLPGKVKTQYSKWEDAHFGKESGLYAVYSDNELNFYQAIGKMDSGIRTKEDEPDRFIGGPFTSKDREYKEFTIRYIKKIRDAQTKGISSIEIGSNTYNIIPNAVELSTEKLRCNEVMSNAECLLLYNACDPVMCPTSRCNLGGKYKVQSVIKSGLVGSIVLCLPNIKDGVLVPVCLTGILASLKNIRSYLQQYSKCLTVQKTEGKSTGICERIRSIYMCEVIWKEVMPIFLQLGKGLLGVLFGSSDEGSEYTSGMQSRMSQTTKTFNYFTNSYAKDIFAAYKAKTTEQIGVEFCKAAIGGTLPNFGKLMEEIATPEDPVQYSAFVEEHDYSTTKSSYQVYYHIYAGTPKREQIINYQVILRAKGRRPIRIAQGSLRSGESADETIEKIEDKGYNEVCVTAGGPMQCGFGKLVSTSFGLQQIFDELAGATAKKITQTKDCISGAAPIVGLQLQQIPRPNVVRKCSTSNPYLGLGNKKESEWQVVGQCNDEDGTNRGYCWAQLNTAQYPEIEERAGEYACSGSGLKLCEKYEACSGGAVISTANKRECCQGGICESFSKELGIDEININTEINNLNTFDASQKSDLKQYYTEIKANNGKIIDRDDSLHGRIATISKLSKTKDEFYFILGLIHFKYANFDKAEESFNKIFKKELREKAGDYLIQVYMKKQNWDQVATICKDFKPEDENCEKAKTRKAEETIAQKIKSASTCQKAENLYSAADIKNQKIISQALLELGKNCFNKQKYSNAITHLQTLTASNEDEIKTEAIYYYKVSELENIEKYQLSKYTIDAVELTDIKEITKNDDLKDKIDRTIEFLTIYKEYKEDGDKKTTIDKLKALKDKASVGDILTFIIKQINILSGIEKGEKCATDTECESKYTPHCKVLTGECVECLDIGQPGHCTAIFGTSAGILECQSDNKCKPR